MGKKDGNIPGTQIKANMIFARKSTENAEPHPKQDAYFCIWWSRPELRQ